MEPTTTTSPFRMLVRLPPAWASTLCPRIPRAQSSLVFGYNLIYSSFNRFTSSAFEYACAGVMREVFEVHATVDDPAAAIVVVFLLVISLSPLRGFISAERTETD